MSWFENYTGDDLPHENWWDDSDAIEEHFKAVRIRKDQGDSGPGGSAYDSATDNSEEMAGNDLASVFKD